jgi:hypothetical protein
MADRRTFLMLLMLGAALPAATTNAFADKGSGGGEGGGNGNGNSGSSGSGNSGSGGSSGSDHGGSDDGGSDDKGSDDKGSDDNGSDDKGSDDGSSNSGSGSKGKTGSAKNSDDGEDEEDDSQRIRAAVKKGEAAPLRKILDAVRQKYKGEIVGIKLVGKGKSLQYRIRLIDPKNNLIEVRVDAARATIVGTAGFY